MSPEPLFSICIPTRNRAHLIGKALDSCVTQTYQNIEIIVMDNDSSEDVKAVVKKHAKGNIEVKYFKNEHNIGLGRNLIKAFQMASGDYVQYLADDNWLAKNYAEEKIRCFKENPNTAFVASKLEKYQNIDGIRKPIITSNIKEGKISKDFAFRYFYRTSGWFGLLCSARKQDLLEAVAALGEIPNPYGYIYLDNFFAYDVLLYVYILSKYDFMYYTDKTVYYDLMSPSEVNNPALSNLVKWHDMYKYAAHYTFSMVGKPQYISSFKSFLGASLALEILRRLVIGPRKGIGLSCLSRFYSDFTLAEWIKSFKEVLPLLFKRVVSFSKKLLPSRKYLPKNSNKT